jgi:CBS domain-containing protein
MTPLSRSRAITVGAIMHRGVISCPAQMPMAGVAALMAQHSVHCVVVDGAKVGPRSHERLARDFVTDVDVMRATGSGRLDAEAGEATAKQIVTVHPDENIERAAQIMSEHDCSHLVVVSADGVEPLGVISSLDVARAVSRPPG